MSIATRTRTLRAPISRLASSCTGAKLLSSSSFPTSAQAPPQETGTRFGWSKWLLFLPGAITFGLGTWQILRRQDKLSASCYLRCVGGVVEAGIVDRLVSPRPWMPKFLTPVRILVPVNIVIQFHRIKMLDFRQQRLDSEPITLNTASPTRDILDFQEFRRVKCQGVLDEKRSIYVGPRSRVISGVTENGYYVITPLMPVPNNRESMQSPVLVNRGWVPRSWRDKSLEAPQDCDQVSDTATPIQDTKQSSRWKIWSSSHKNIEDEVPATTPVQVIGVVRGSENPNHFVPENNPSSGEWFYVDVPAIARACGLPENTMYIEDINGNINPRNPYPIPKDVNTLIRTSVMPQDHLNYTFTWYSLSAAVTFMAFKRLRQKRSHR